MSDATPTKNAVCTPAQFRKQATSIAYSMLRDWVGEAKAKEATGRIAVAVAASAAAAKNPRDFYRCTEQSVATCIAISALTNIMPSTGAASLAYLVPQPPRKDEPPMLQYQLSHRGLNALARRCGQVMIAIPISHTDKIENDEFGLFRVVSRDIDNPPSTYEELRGVMLVVKELRSGIVTATGFVSKKLISQRKAMSRAGSGSHAPWTKWPVEMAQKTAMHYAIARGWCVIDDTAAVRALAVDIEADSLAGSPSNTIEGKVAKGTEGLRQRLGMSPEPETFESGAGDQREPETVAATDRQETTNVGTQGEPEREESDEFWRYYEQIKKATGAKALKAIKDQVEGEFEMDADERDSLLAELADRMKAAGEK